jgi:shikimate kinase / 3-dehydroquinate synthase
MPHERIFLVGLSGSGKSTVAGLVARELGWRAVDVDRQVESTTGREISEIFSAEGEAAFRSIEADAMEMCLESENIVVATGGGAVTHERSRSVIAQGFSVWLASSPEVAARRLSADPATEERPLLQGEGLQPRLESLLQERLHLYQSANAAVDVDDLPPEAVAHEIVRLWFEHRSAAGHSSSPESQIPAFEPDGDVAAIVRTPTAAYPIVVANGALSRLGEICRGEGLKGRAFVIADSAVRPLYGEQVLGALSAAGYEPKVFDFQGGESEKHLGTVSTIYDWLVDARCERGDFVVCLGGGVVTDLGGFVAATFLRGVSFVHAPTSLLGMVDAAIGGKTGVDHPKGKNLVGAFAQPRAVVIDPNVLATLPSRELRAGWAEVVKHGLILDEALFDLLSEVAGDPAAMADPYLIGWSTHIKAIVVSEDEREADRRTLLNYGHTIGHAIEAVTGYSQYLHGEAVAIGMRAAGIISMEKGLLSPEEFDLQQSVLERCGLPVSAPNVSSDAVLEATLLDKKVTAGKVRWVLLDRIGHASIHADVDDSLVRHAVETVLS